ncbi:hypothetical protein HOD05_01365 [Candidatus Woesearchaeota archaeon]|jgi:hypothetical protein|nr:hypothetical protein [Candidatus Woesearchaeota archaeon]MBT4151054.1 hypothetical protein [Candidatus Woesearchaeota archaeon]MBT4433844.1 hypothetical protein [Candidatus Woesearchaeota archaeon]MBT7332157.1 hypothetical protein [Candidatus Woesearchaeota archaeon]
MKKVVVVFVILLLFLVACTEVVEESPEAPVGKAIEVVPEPTPEPEPVVEKQVFLGCKDTSECQGIEQCIEGECKTIAQLYKTDCDVKCNFKSILVETSDGESTTINRGQGSYSYAGALAWTLQSGPDYCKEDKVIVPIKLEKNSYGKILETQTIILSPGETSDIITHPTVKSMSFTAKIVSVDESCN